MLDSRHFLGKVPGGKKTRENSRLTVSAIIYQPSEIDQELSHSSADLLCAKIRKDLIGLNAMAAETTVSSSASTYVHVGELVSLTSTSEIRYEGLLADLSRENFTIGLRNVRCFGTEGRSNNGREVAPDERIFDYVLFRGISIKDLKVITYPSLCDPAIIIQSHTPQVTTTFANTSVGPRFNARAIQYKASPLSTDNSGFNGYKNSFQPHQQAMPHQPAGLSVPSTHSIMQYPQSNGLSGNSGLRSSQLLESSSLSLASNKNGGMNFHSTKPPAPPSTSLAPAMSSDQSFPCTSFLASPSIDCFISELSMALPVFDASSSIVSGSTSKYLSSGVERSSVLPNDPLNPSLVTQSQLFRPELSSSASVALPIHPLAMESANVCANAISFSESKAPMFEAHEPSKTSGRNNVGQGAGCMGGDQSRAGVENKGKRPELGVKQRSRV